MISSDHILDRGRMLLGVLLVMPLGAMIPGIAGGSRGDDGPTWQLTASTPNPIVVDAPTPRDVLARLTNPTTSAGAAASNATTSSPTTSGAAPSAPGGTAPAAAAPADPVAEATAAVAAAEVGSESTDDPPESVAIPGTAPDADLAAKLRASQARFAPPQSSVASGGSGSEGPLPFATPSVAVYPAVPGAAHLFPIVGGASFSNDWGGPRPGGRSHQGIDMFATTGTPIIAIADGTLFKVGWNRVGGWRFWLRDQWGNEFYHAHLSAFAPAAVEGAVVKAGTVIGFVGNTGDARTTPPHLHFEIHPGGGGPIPPFSYVSAWPRV